MTFKFNYEFFIAFLFGFYILSRDIITVFGRAIETDFVVALAGFYIGCYAINSVDWHNTKVIKYTIPYLIFTTLGMYNILNLYIIDLIDHPFIGAALGVLSFYIIRFIYKKIHKNIVK